MKLIHKLSACLVALLAASITANACIVTVRIACPNDTTASGIRVYIDGVGETTTDSLGLAEIHVPYINQKYTVCVDESTLPAGATLVDKNACKEINVNSLAPPVINFNLKGGAFCKPPEEGACWMTGGGTVDKVQGTPDYSFGGVVYPGCSPKAGQGGNWNVVDHLNSKHFQGRVIIVDGCSGVPTKSPKVTLNVIDFHGTGLIGGIAGDDDLTVPVEFEARAVDNKDGGAGSDLLYLRVFIGTTTVMQIGTSLANPAVISTGNIQIHQSSCGK